MPVLVAALAFVWLGYCNGRSAGEQGDPSYFAKFGSDFAGAREMIPTGAKVFAGTGYDGQFYFYIAQDPFLTHNGQTESHLDHVAYRYQRILYPLVAWAASGGGDRDALVWVLPILNILAVLAFGALLANFLSSHGRSPWWSLAAMLAIGQVVGVVNDLADPFATSLFFIGLLLWARDKTLGALIAMTAAVFAREIFLIPLVMVCAVEMVRWRRRAWVWIVPILAVGGWEAYMRLGFADQGSAAYVETPQPAPFLGAVSHIRSVLRNDVVGAANWEILFITLSLVAWLYLLVASARIVYPRLRQRVWPSRAQLAPAVALLSVVFTPFLSNALWRNPLSYTRYGVGLTVGLMILFAMRHVSAGVLIGAFIALSLANPVIPLLPTQAGPVITPPGPAPVNVPGQFGGP